LTFRSTTNAGAGIAGTELFSLYALSAIALSVLSITVALVIERRRQRAWRL
jgi:hypothetical protein